MTEHATGVADPTLGVIREVRNERNKQDAKWGEQNWPSLDRVLLKRKGSCSPEQMAQDYEIPGANRAKFMCDSRHRNGELTWAHILIEELAEVVECLDDEAAMREELIQVAAVAVAWIECIDRRSK